MFNFGKLKDFAPGGGAATGAFVRRLNTHDWIDVPVPGDVHQALVAAGRIEDPFYDRNEPKCAWVEGREWWYRLSFDGPLEPIRPDERLLLVFHGLDTFVTVWLNGEELGRHRNMFREAVFDVGGRVRFGEPNTLALCFDRPLDHVGVGAPDQWGRNPERVAMRKAQFGFGWDWAPRLPTVGIWRPIELRRERRAAICGVHFSTLEVDRKENQAVVAVRVEAERFAAAGPLTATITLISPSAASDRRIAVERTLILEGHGARLTATAYLVVKKPQLWWTHDLGEPVLYDLRVALEQDSAGMDQRRLRVGIRTLELDQSPDPAERGTRFFRFVLNGVPIFARGANWIPADSFVSAIPPGRYEALLGTAREANMNMIRVWGGGIYEHDLFYDLCDRLGLLVWQDFMFACATYPEEPPEFVAEVEAEARYQVRRLRSHPCLALWCGNNENQWIHDRTFWERPDTTVPGALYYEEILPRTVTELDGRTPYWPGSPYGGNDHNGREEGNVHNWEVWHGNFPRRFGERPRRDPTPENVSYLRYGEDTGRFITEFGMHAAPVFETLRRTIPPEELYHHSSSMDHHNKDDPKNKGDNLMLSITGLPKDLEEYVDYSMITQAEGLKFGIEHFRRRKPHCSGTLFWQLNDCWPALSWSVLDYFGFGKAGYYYIKRAYAPVLASFKGLSDGDVELWVTNDTLKEVKNEVIVRLMTFAGDIVLEERPQVQVAPNCSRPVWRLKNNRIDGRPDRYLSVRSENNMFASNRHFFSAIKDLKRRPVRPEVETTANGDYELQVRLRAPEYAYFVHLIASEEVTHFADNYFDLEPDESRTVIVTNRETALTPEMVKIGWR